MQNNTKYFLFAVATSMVVMEPTFAAGGGGTGGAEFTDIWTTVSDWMTGFLGRLIAGTFVLVGVIAGVVRQSLMAFVVGIGGGVGLTSIPAIIDNIFTATIEKAPEITEVMNLTNGLL